MYVPTILLPDALKTMHVEQLAKAMIVDAERFVTGKDEKEMRARLGWRGLRRFEYPQILQLADRYDDEENDDKDTTSTIIHSAKQL